MPSEPVSPGTRQRTTLLALIILLLVFLALLLGPVRSTAADYRVGPADAARVWLRNSLKGPVRVGVQVGHEAAADQPDELAGLRQNTGGHFASLDELTVNRAVATRLQSILQDHGIAVELLPATVPVLYSADLVLSVHADSVDDTARNGYKSAHFEPARNSLEPILKDIIDRVYLDGSGLRDDSINTSGAMHYYYGFNNRAYRHTVNPQTPALLVELGYISNSGDRGFLTDSDEPARLLAEGVLQFLEEIRRVPPR